MKTESIALQVIAIIADITGIPPSKVNLQSRLTEDLKCDDLEPVEIALALEEEFNIKINTAEQRGIETVRDLVMFVKARLNNGDH